MDNKALKKSIEFIDSWLQFRYKQVDLPGYAVAISYKGKVVFNGTYGYADIENKTEVSTSTIFRIASQSKSFTATALMQLQEEGKLRIDDYVIDYLPWLKKHKDKRWQKVTLRQLMSHSAGVVRDGLDADYWQLEKPFPNNDELQHEVLNASLVIDNNIKLKYSNIGYSLLGSVIEIVSGKTYNDYVIAHIIKPLGLKNTRPEYTPKINDQLAVGYTSKSRNEPVLPIEHADTKSMSAATGFCSTTEDLCKYYTAQMVGSGVLLSDESKKEMQRTQFHIFDPHHHMRIDYGLGLQVEDTEAGKLLSHGGGFPGQTTKSLFSPERELVVTVAINSMNGPATGMSKGVLKIIEFFQKNSAGKPKHKLDHFKGRYLNLWGSTEIVSSGDKIMAVYPETWYPFSDPEPLERVDKNTLKITQAHGLASEGELIHFKKDGTIQYGGMTMWPEAAWGKKIKNLKNISLNQ